jgi:hypothetical protein
MSPGIGVSTDVYIDIETIFPGSAPVIPLFLSSTLCPLQPLLSYPSLPGETSLAV